MATLTNPADTDPNAPKPPGATVLARLRDSTPAKIGIATVLIAGQIVATQHLFPHSASQGYVVFEVLFAGIAAFLAPTAGFAAVGASAVLIAYFALQGEGFAVSDPTEALGLVAFIGGGLGLVSLVGWLRGRLQRAEAERGALEIDSADKAALLSELSHRIRNDLGSLMSLALLQMSSAESEETKEALSGIANRIQVFGAVYRRLNTAATHHDVEMRTFLTGLCADLRDAHLTMRPVSLKVKAEPQPLAVGQAALVGLVLNEALTNALKYAFPENRPGTIRVGFGPDPSDPETLRLTVSDDGVGPRGGAPEGTGMGQRLMRAMASQLGGSYALERDGEATVAKLSFPVERSEHATLRRPTP